MPCNRAHMTGLLEEEGEGTKRGTEKGVQKGAETGSREREGSGTRVMEERETEIERLGVGKAHLL